MAALSVGPVMIKRKSLIKRSVRGIPRKRQRRKKGEISRLKLRLWKLCKAIIRKQYLNPDGTWTCYTSGKKIVEPKNVHTGHYIASSLCSVELRYDIKNLRPQSYNENINHSGNPLQFRLNLIRDHGQEYVDALWERNEETKGKTYNAQWFINQCALYEQLLAEL